MVPTYDLDMALLEREATELLSNPDVAPLQKRREFAKLLARYFVLQDYQKALAAYIRQMLAESNRSPVPEAIVESLLGSAEFELLSAIVLAAYISVTYSAGPRASWVPTLLIPSPDFTMTGTTLGMSPHPSF